MSIAVETTKLIVEHLKDIFPEVECRRSYCPVLDPTELDEIGKTVLCVVPVTREAEQYTVGGMQKNELAIDICINAKLHYRNTDDPEEFNDEIDEYIAFAEKVYSVFLKKIAKNVDGLKVSFDQPEHVVLLEDNILQGYNCFLSVVRVNAEVYAKPEV